MQRGETTKTQHDQDEYRCDGGVYGFQAVSVTGSREPFMQPVGCFGEEDGDLAENHLNQPEDPAKCDPVKKTKERKFLSFTARH